MTKKQSRQVVRIGGVPVANAELIVGLTQLVSQVTDTVQVVQQERTQRQRMSDWRDAEVARIRETAALLRLHLARQFDERELVLVALLDRLGLALAADQSAVVEQLLTAVSGVLRDNPLAILADETRVSEHLGDPDHVWQV